MYRSRKRNKQYKPEESQKKIRTGDKLCPFCHDLGEEALDKTKYNLVVRNIFPYQYWEFLEVVDHLLIVPRRHIESLAELTAKEKVDTIDLIAAYEERGYNVYAREKANHIKSIPHQHTHLIKTRGKRARFYMHLRRPYLVWKV